MYTTKDRRNSVRQKFKNNREESEEKICKPKEGSRVYGFKRTVNCTTWSEWISNICTDMVNFDTCPQNGVFPARSPGMLLWRLPRFGDMRTRRLRDERGVEPPQVNWWLLKISVNPYKMRPAPRVPGWCMVYPGDNYLRQKSPDILIIAGISVWPHQGEQSTGERGGGL